MPAAQRCVRGATSARSAIGAASSGTHHVGQPGTNPTQPTRSGVGIPAASSERPAASAPTWEPSQVSPGSASSPQTFPVRSWYHTSGAERRAAGTTTQITLAMPRPRRRTAVSTIAPIHTMTSAGASEGAHATTAARSEGCRSRPSPMIDVRRTPRRRATAGGGAREPRSGAPESARPAASAPAPRSPRPRTAAANARSPASPRTSRRGRPAAARASHSTTRARDGSKGDRAAEHRQHRRERVGRTDRVEARRTQAVRGIRPQLQPRSRRGAAARRRPAPATLPGTGTPRSRRRVRPEPARRRRR